MFLSFFVYLLVCSTTLKRICRQHGIKRWPSRKIKKVGHSLQKLQLVIDSVQGASGAFQIDSFYTNFPELDVSGTSPFSASKLSHGNPKASSSQMQQTGGGTGLDASKSSSSCSQSSSSSQCCTSRSQQQNSTWNDNNNNNVASSKEIMAGENNSNDVVLKRVRSEAGLNNTCTLEDDKKLMPRSQSQKSLIEHSKTGKNNNIITTLVSKNTSERLCQELGGDFQRVTRVKVTYGDEKTRFRMKTNWGFKNLQQEIGSRFGIEDMGLFTIKYLDDDSEWVLLTCDADLEECFEVCRSSQNNTIKLSLQVSRHLSRGYLGGGNVGPLRPFAEG